MASGFRNLSVYKNAKYNEINNYQAINIELSHAAGVTIS